MQPQTPKQNAVAAIRVSTTKQGTDGDSPEAQKEQIERYAEAHGLNIKKYFVFLESASQELQPMQEVVDYCKNPRNNIQQFIIKSIDRFTRGGSYFYDDLKMQLDGCNVALVDIYGVISTQKVNTLDHLGFQYGWSVYSPSKKSEILEAERAKDEMRDIMSRMIGAEIRYTQMGYWMRRPPYGYISEKIETPNGKRCILKPHPSEASLMIKMFELKAQGTLGDHQIAAELNRLGFKTRIELIRSKADRSQIVAQKGGSALTAKMLNRYIQNPIYAGINQEKWTQNKPVKCKFDGLVSYELFNKANQSKLTILGHEDGSVTIHKKQPLVYRSIKNFNNPEFAYRKIVTCPKCKNSLIGSASRGAMGKYYPAYHCSKYGHYFRVPKESFEETIAAFTNRMVVSSERLEEVIQAVLTVWEQRQLQDEQKTVQIGSRRQELETQIKVIVDKMKLVSSETAIKYMEEDLQKIEQQLANLDFEREKEEHMNKKIVDMPVILTYVKYLAEHLKELLLHHSNPLNRAAYFAVLFDKVPSYDILADGTEKIADITEVSELFRIAHSDDSNLVSPPRLERRSAP